MAMAKGYPEGDEGGRGKKGTARNLAETAGASGRRVREARQVLGHSPALAKAVLAGNRSLDEALAEVKADEIRLTSEETKMERLRSEAPDLVNVARCDIQIVSREPCNSPAQTRSITAAATAN
jgi:hypothetical protein